MNAIACVALGEKPSDKIRPFRHGRGVQIVPGGIPDEIRHSLRQLLGRVSREPGFLSDVQQRLPDALRQRIIHVGFQNKAIVGGIGRGEQQVGRVYRE